jgi:hypothetical protein
MQTIAVAVAIMLYYSLYTLVLGCSSGGVYGTQPYSIQHCTDHGSNSQNIILCLRTHTHTLFVWLLLLAIHYLQVYTVPLAIF